MDKFEEKNVIGGLDRLLMNVGMAFIALIPTYIYLIFKPKALCSLLKDEESDGRQGLKLGPAVTFIFTILVLLAIGYLFRGVGGSEVAADGQEIARKGIRAAVSEGNFWRSIILSLPLYLAALVLGVLFHFSHRIIRKQSDLRQAVGVGFYILSTVFISMIPLGRFMEELGPESIQTGVIFAIILLSIFIILPWQMFSFSRHAFGNSKGDAAAVALICFVLIFISFVVFGMIGSSLSSSQ